MYWKTANRFGWQTGRNQCVCECVICVMCMRVERMCVKWSVFYFLSTRETRTSMTDLSTILRHRRLRVDGGRRPHCEYRACMLYETKWKKQTQLKFVIIKKSVQTSYINKCIHQITVPANKSAPNGNYSITGDRRKPVFACLKTKNTAWLGLNVVFEIF